jgi:hypothetical protein
MPVVIQCACGHSLHVGDDLVGKPLACPACGARLLASAPSPITAVPPTPPLPAAPPPLPQTAPAPLTDLGEVLGVWGLMELISGPNMTVLTRHAFCTGQVARGEVKEAKRQLAAGAPVWQVLGSSLRVIPLAAIQAVRLSNKEATLTLGYWDGPRRAQLTIQYVQPVQRWVYDTLRPRLGPGWSEESVEATAVSALSMPLTVIGFLLGFTILGFFAARQREGGFVQQSNRGKFWDVLTGWIPSVACIGIALVLAAVGVVWMIYSVIKRPLAVITITRTSEASRGRQPPEGVPSGG